MRASDMRFISALLAVILVLGGSMATAQVNTSVFFLENWENRNDGDSPIVNGWSASGVPLVRSGNIGRPYFADDRCVVEVDGVLSRNDLHIQPSPDGLFKIEYDFRTEIGWAGLLEIPFGYGQAGSRRVYYKVLGEGFAYDGPVWRYGYGQLQVFNGSDYVDLVSLVDNVNYHVVDVFTAGSATHHFSVAGDGELIFEGDLSAPVAFDSSVFSHLEFGVKTGSDSKIFFDNMQVISGNDNSIFMNLIAELAAQWLDCTDPTDSSCAGWYWE